MPWANSVLFHLLAIQVRHINTTTTTIQHPTTRTQQPNRSVLVNLKNRQYLHACRGCRHSSYYNFGKLWIKWKINLIWSWIYSSMQFGYQCLVKETRFVTSWKLMLWGVQCVGRDTQLLASVNTLLSSKQQRLNSTHRDMEQTKLQKASFGMSWFWFPEVGRNLTLSHSYCCEMIAMMETPVARHSSGVPPGSTGPAWGSRAARRRPPPTAASATTRRPWSWSSTRRWPATGERTRGHGQLAPE